MRENAPLEESTSRHIIRELARQTHTSVEEAGVAFEQMVADLKSDARITMYVPVLASRKAREQLKRSAAGK